MTLPQHFSVREKPTNPVVCTIFCKNYLAQTRFLYETLRATNPTISFVALLVDRPEGLFDPSHEPFEILQVESIGVRDLDAIFTGKDRQGACCTLKPLLLFDLLDRGFDPVIYLDPDILVLDSLNRTIEDIAGHSISLTPHFLALPHGHDRVDRELRLLRGGTFNGGFLGVSREPETLEFLRWWSARLQSHCSHDPAKGIHYDQRWLDLVPSLFAGAQVLRDPGLNVAYWNFEQRAFRLESNAAFVGADRCRFFHFSGYDPARPERMTRFDDLRPVGETAVAALFARYQGALIRHGWEDTHTWPYSWACDS